MCVGVRTDFAVEVGGEAALYMSYGAVVKVRAHRLNDARGS